MSTRSLHMSLVPWSNFESSPCSQPEEKYMHWGEDNTYFLLRNDVFDGEDDTDYPLDSRPSTNLMD